MKNGVFPGVVSDVTYRYCGALCLSWGGGLWCLHFGWFEDKEILDGLSYKSQQFKSTQINSNQVDSAIVVLNS